MTPAPTGGQLPNMSLRKRGIAALVIDGLRSEHGRYKNNGRETGAFHLFLPHVEAKA
jgi:hypothetical protein